VRRLGVLDRVPHQALEDDPDRVRVAEPRQGRSAAQLDGRGVALEAAPEALGHLVRDQCDVGSAGAEARRPAEQQHLLDVVREPLELPLHHRRRSGQAFVAPGLEDEGLGLNGGREDRVAERVRDLVDEPLGIGRGGGVRRSDGGGHGITSRAC